MQRCVKTLALSGAAVNPLTTSLAVSTPANAAASGFPACTDWSFRGYCVSFAVGTQFFYLKQQCAALQDSVSSIAPC